MSSRKYQETHITTSSPMALVIMLYDEAIKAIEMAEEAFQINDPSRIEKIGNHLLHAQDVITELAVSLDMEKGGEIAHHLHRLYDFMVVHLSKADVTKEIQGVRDVHKMLCELRQAWNEVAKQEVAGEEQPPRQRAMEINSTIQITG